jgi:hypothetical protein
LIMQKSPATIFDDRSIEQTVIWKNELFAIR